jgi:hypothetical protein
MLHLGLWSRYSLVEYEILVCSTSWLGSGSMIVFVVVVA